MTDAPRPADVAAKNEGDNTVAIAAHGAQLLIRLTALLRTGRTYDVSNQAFQHQLQESHSLI